MSKGLLTSNSSGEGEIRKAIVEARLIDCIVNLPSKLFLNTQLPACLWFLSQNKGNGKFRYRKDEILFIDARNLGFLINRRTLRFSAEDISKITTTYHNWRTIPSSNLADLNELNSLGNEEQLKSNYEDIKGFCCSASIEKVKDLDYVLSPGRYVALPDEEDDFDFKERFPKLTAEFEAQLEEEKRLNDLILFNLRRVKYE